MAVVQKPQCVFCASERNCSPNTGFLLLNWSFLRYFIHNNVSAFESQIFTIEMSIYYNHDKG